MWFGVRNLNSYLGDVYDPKESGGQTAKYRHISYVESPVNNLDTNCVLVTTEIPYSIYEWISFQERGKIWVTLGKSEHKFKLQQIPIKLPILKEGVWIEDTENILPHRIFWHSCLLLLLHMTIRHGIEVSRNSGGGGVEVKCNVITPESPWYISPLSSSPWYHPWVPSS